MTGQEWMALAAGTLIVSSLVMAKLDDAMRAKADRDRTRWADDAIDLTGGAR